MCLWHELCHLIVHTNGYPGFMLMNVYFFDLLEQPFCGDDCERRKQRQADFLPSAFEVDLFGEMKPKAKTHRPSEQNLNLPTNDVIKQVYITNTGFQPNAYCHE